MLPRDATCRLLQGALIATAWTALMHLGEQGYLDHTARIMQVRLNPTDCAPLMNVKAVRPAADCL